MPVYNIFYFQKLDGKHFVLISYMMEFSSNFKKNINIQKFIKYHFFDKKVCIDKFRNSILPLNHLEWASPFLEIERDWNKE